MGKLDQQIAIVTGGSKGIGKAISAVLARQGAHVVVVAREEARLKDAVSELQREGLRASSFAADVSSEQQVSSLVGKTVKEFGRIDILVNNAGVGVFKHVSEMSVAEFDMMWNVNMRGVFLATKAVLPHMMKVRSGNIVNISSLAGKNINKGGAGYGATKWALRGFAGSLMLEVREFNIRVVTVFPGSVDTAFSSAGKHGSHITQPEDVAAAVLFAVSAPGRTMFSEIDVRPTIPK